MSCITVTEVVHPININLNVFRLAEKKNKGQPPVNYRIASDGG